MTAAVIFLGARPGRDHAAAGDGGGGGGGGESGGGGGDGALLPIHGSLSIDGGGGKVSGNAARVAVTTHLAAH